MVITVYRIENIHDNKGIFNSRGTNPDPDGDRLSDSFTFSGTLFKNHRDMPIPQNEPKLKDYFNADYYCAYQSEEILKIFVSDEWLDELKSFGFRKLKIELSNCIVGDYQTIFKAEDVISKTEI